MAETAALLADEVFPEVPLRQWVISFPFPLLPRACYRAPVTARLLPRAGVLAD
jgi:hypothetical protein